MCSAQEDRVLVKLRDLYILCHIGQGEKITTLISGVKVSAKQLQLNVLQNCEARIFYHVWSTFGTMLLSMHCVFIFTAGLSQRYKTFISFFHVLTCITSFQCLSITCNVFIAFYIISTRCFKPELYSSCWF